MVLLTDFMSSKTRLSQSDDEEIDINPVDIQSPLIDVKQSPKFYNTEEYWTLWIGLCWYMGVVLVTGWGVDISRIMPWNGTDISKSFQPSNVGGITLMGFLTVASLIIVHYCVNKVISFSEYFAIIMIVILCKIVGNYVPLHNAGFGDSVWCIVIGMFCRNTLGRIVPINKSVLSLDFFIKVSIVLLAINLQQVVVAGAKGLVVSWIETSILFLTVYFIGTKLIKINSEQSVITSAGLSICGSSAVLSIKDVVGISADEVTSFITMMSVFTIVLIPTLPIAAKRFHLNSETAGAWIGGCVDSTGAVSASASLLGQSTLHFAIIIKMLQNVMIGPFALGVTVIWNKTFNVWILWDKFPKFLIGFTIVCVITTLLPNMIRDRVVDNSFILSEWFASIAFVLIGIDVDVLDLYDKLKAYRGMLILYLIGQTLDIMTTLGSSYLMFTVISPRNETFV